MSAFGGKADIAEPRPDHFQPPAPTRYDAFFLVLGQAMRRREFITLIGGSAFAWRVPASAQQAEKMRRIGILMLFAETDRQAHADYAAFTAELQRMGWTEGQNIRIDQRWASGDVNRLQALAAELVDLKPDLFVVQGSAALAALQHATRTLPIIFAEVTDPVGQGFVESLARPGGNTTGFAMFELSMGEKWLDLLKKLRPSIKQVAVLSNPATSTAPFAKLYFQSINAAAPRFGIKLLSLEVDDKTDLERLLSDLARDPSNGLIVLLDAFTYANREFVIDQVARHRIPAIYTVSLFAEAGGLASYGVDLPDQFGRAATYVDRIFRGTRSADLPVQQPTKFRLVINLKLCQKQTLQLVDMNEVIRVVLKSLSRDLNNHHIKLRSELMSELPRVYGNRSQLQEVMSNLIVNAIEAMEPTSDRSRVLLVRSELRDPKAVAVIVNDSGPGIDKDRLDSIFSAFVSTKRHGMGLGLAISRMLIDYHGGRLTALSDGRDGSPFQFVLPIASSDRDSALAQ